MRQLIIISGMAVASLLYSCSKSSAPTPPPVDTGTGTGTGNGSGTAGGGTKPPTYTRVIIYTVGGNGSFDKSNQLVGIGLSDVNVGSMFKTALSTNTNTTTELVHADGGILDKNLGQWAMRFPDYSATDTTKQPYLQTIVTDANKNITEYRTYIVGTGAVLYKYEVNKPADKMTNADFLSAFQTVNTQKVLQAQEGLGVLPSPPKVMIVNGGTISYDANGNIIRVNFTSDLKGVVDLVPGGNITIELVNAELDPAPQIAVAKGGSGFQYHNLYKSFTEDLGSTENIKAILAKDIYLRIKGLPEYSELDLIVVDNGGFGAGGINFIGTTDITSSAKIKASFEKAKLKVQAISVK